MKQSKEIVGHIDYDGASYPFQFDRDSFLITFFPPSLTKFLEDSKPINRFMSFLEIENDVDWSKTYELNGKTDGGQKVTFCVTVNATSACPTADVVACPWIAEYACP